MAVVDREVGFKWRYYTPTLVVDGASNKFTARVKSTGGDAWLQVFKRTPDGARTLIHEERSVLGKTDHAAIVQSGADLHWTMTAHEGDTACNEQEGVLHGVCVPYGAEGPQLGRAGAYDGGNQVPDPTPTVDEIKQAVKEVLGIALNENLMHVLRHEVGADTYNIRQGLEDKAKSAITELNLWSASLQERGLDLYIMDRVFQCLTDNWPDQFPKPVKPEEPEQP